MPSFDHLRAKHLTIVKSEKVPVRDIPTFSNKIESSHSGSTYRVGGIASAVTLTLPSAKKGRLFSFIVTNGNSANVSIAPKSGDTFAGNFLADQGSFTYTGSVSVVLLSFPANPFTITVGVSNIVAIDSPTTFDETVTFPALISVSTSGTFTLSQNAVYNIAHNTSVPVQIGTGAGIGSKIDFICLADGIWYVTGVGNGTISSYATNSTAVFV